MTDLERVADALEAQWHAHPRPSPIRPDRVRIVLDAPTKLLTMNAAKSTHYREWSNHTRAWRGAMCSRAEYLGISRVPGPVGVECWPHQAGGILADPGAHMPCLKACIDGLRDAGVLEDDTGKQVAWVRMWPPVKGPGEGMVLELVAV